MTRLRLRHLPLVLLLAATAVLYLVGLSQSGWANPYYSAAAQAASQSWKAFLFGSFDSANFITVDKTPASLWLMGLSVRVFGLSSFAILLPQALCGVASVGVLYATVRRWSGHAAGLVAGAVLALTPVAVLMFRFNNPDALLVLALTVGAYGVTRAVQTGQTRWLVLAGSAVGIGFLAKMLQAFLVLPAFGLAYLIAGPPKLGKRLLQLGAAFGAMIVSAGWWIAIVELWPASSRPYVGGSQNNSILELTLGYNGLGRITGEEVGSVGANGGQWGDTGVLRLFSGSYAGQASWLMPAALILLVAGLVATARLPRASLERAGLVVWGGWLLTTAAVFSYMQGIIHEYYTVALAPAIGALIGGGGALMWRRGWHAVNGAAVAVTAWWGFTLLGRATSFVPWLRWIVLIGGLVAGLALVALQFADRLRPAAAEGEAERRGIPLWAKRAVVTGALAVGLAGPLSFSLQTAATAHTGAIVTAGPSVGGRGGMGGPGGGGPGMTGQNGAGQNGQNGRGQMGQNGTGQTGQDGRTRGGTTQGGTTQQGGLPSGMQPPGGTVPGGTAQGGTTQGGFPGGGMTGGGRGAGGLLNASAPSDALKALLTENADNYTWIAATIGSNNAAGIQLALEKPVMAIGGFNGSDDAPSLEQFQQWVAEGKIHYYVGGNGFQANGGSTVPREIAQWVQANFTAQTVGNVTVYNLDPK